MLLGCAAMIADTLVCFRNTPQTPHVVSLVAPLSKPHVEQARVEVVDDEALALPLPLPFFFFFLLLLLLLLELEELEEEEDPSSSSPSSSITTTICGQVRRLVMLVRFPCSS